MSFQYDHPELYRATRYTLVAVAVGSSVLWSITSITDSPRNSYSEHYLGDEGCLTNTPYDTQNGATISSEPSIDYTDFWPAVDIVVTPKTPANIKLFFRGPKPNPIAWREVIPDTQKSKILLAEYGCEIDELATRDQPQ